MSGIAGLYSMSVFSLLGNCQTVFHTDCTILFSCQQGSDFSTTLAILVVPLFDDSHPTRHEVVFHCGFDLPYSDG